MINCCVPHTQDMDVQELPGLMPSVGMQGPSGESPVWVVPRSECTVGRSAKVGAVLQAA